MGQLVLVGELCKEIPLLHLRYILFVACAAFPVVAFAQVSGPADASRVDQRVRMPELPQHTAAPAPLRGSKSVANPPAGSEKIKFVLRTVQLDGAQDMDPALSKPAYDEYLGKEISLDTVWLIAEHITERYQAAGFFLSRVYVPQQEIGSGSIRLKVVQGYISEISLDDAAKQNPLVVEWTNRLLNRKPLSSAEIESVLLRLNDIPGFSHRAILELPRAANAPEGAVRLSIASKREAPTARTSIDNFGSRFLGPFEISQQVSMAIIPNQKTTLSFLTATQISELRYGGITQEIPLAYDWTLDLAASLTGARPGYTLLPQDINSTSTNYGVGLTYQWLRQREDNLSMRVGFEGRDTKSTVLGTPLTRDFIRALRVGLNYQGQDTADGYNIAGVTFSQGLSMLGASDANSQNLSRAEAKPNFSKLEINATRVQQLPADFSAVGRFMGQIASGPLYSSEEFGFGGQAFGRAYDSSEITGDHGAEGSIELRYGGIPSLYGAYVMPYGFYDIGRVWNEDAGQSKPVSASSAGFGLRASTEIGLRGNLGVAFPLTRDIATPLNGQSQGPRYMFQVSQDF